MLSLGVDLSERPFRAAVIDLDGGGGILAQGSGADAAEAARNATEKHKPDVAGIATLDAGDTPALPGFARVTRCAPGAAAITAEAWLGAARGARHAICLHIGDEVFAGVLLDGKPWPGAHNRAGAAAWLAINPVERQDYRREGSLAAEVSSKGIARRLSWRIQAGDQSRVLEQAGGSLEAITGRHVFDGARGGDGVAISVIRDTAKYIGMAVATLAAALDPEVVVVSGSVAAADLMLEPVRLECSRRLPPDAMTDLRVEFSALGADAVAIGAARLALAPAGMIRLSGADLVLPDRVAGGGTLLLDTDRIADVILSGGPQPGSSEVVEFHFADHYIVPGFIDVHVHGIEGIDTLDGGDAIGRMAERLPRFGVTAFCPTSIACDPATLARLLNGVRAARTTRLPGGARVLPAHLESNFINPDYKGAQPLECLRRPGSDRGQTRVRHVSDPWTGDDILDEIAAARPDVGIVTVAPELDGAIDLIADLVSHGHHVSLGHSGATYEQAMEGVRAGARQATHLFNRMTPVTHRAPGLAGAMLESDDVIAELVCDGVHVHPAMMRVALAAKRPERIMAITDGTAGSGLPKGSKATLGGRPISVRDAAYLDDGTIAGSVLTMDRAFSKLTSEVGLSLSDAATLCATTPARALGLQGFGVITRGAMADLVVLDRDLRVVQTWIAGSLAWERQPMKG